MAIELFCKCDECGVRLTNGDGITCNGCVAELKKEIEALEEKVAKLEGQLAERGA